MSDNNMSSEPIKHHKNKRRRTLDSSTCVNSNTGTNNKYHKSTNYDQRDHLQIGQSKNDQGSGKRLRTAAVRTPSPNCGEKSSSHVSGIFKNDALFLEEAQGMVQKLQSAQKAIHEFHESNKQQLSQQADDGNDSSSKNSSHTTSIDCIPGLINQILLESLPSSPPSPPPPQCTHQNPQDTSKKDTKHQGRQDRANNNLYQNQQRLVRTYELTQSILQTIFLFIKPLLEKRTIPKSTSSSTSQTSQPNQQQQQHHSTSNKSSVFPSREYEEQAIQWAMKCILDILYQDNRHSTIPALDALLASISPTINTTEKTDGCATMTPSSSSSSFHGLQLALQERMFQSLMMKIDPNEKPKEPLTNRRDSIGLDTYTPESTLINSISTSIWKEIYMQCKLLKRRSMPYFHNDGTFTSRNNPNDDPNDVKSGDNEDFNENNDTSNEKKKIGAESTLHSCLEHPDQWVDVCQQKLMTTSTHNEKAASRQEDDEMIGSNPREKETSKYHFLGTMECFLQRYNPITASSKEDTSNQDDSLILSFKVCTPEQCHNNSSI